MVDKLIQKATKLIKDGEDANISDALWEHCELMVKNAYDLTVYCNKKLSAKDADSADAKPDVTRDDILEAIKSNVRLMKKSVEMTEKCLSGIKDPSGKVSETYICPKCAETQEQPGKCPKCEVVLENQIDYILKTADKLVKEIKPENADSLMTACEQMTKKALAKIKKCNSMLAEDKPVTAEIAQAAKDTNKLVAKSMEVSEKYLLISQEASKPNQKATDEKPAEKK
ncbi:MAG: hypothetical protein V1701_00220 [Planctomycetota bacterium]